MAEVIESCPLLVILVPTCLQWDSLGNRLRGGFVVRIILESGLRNVGVPCGTVVKNPHANARDAGLIPGERRSPGVEMTTHSSIPAWKIPWAEEPGGLQSMESQRRAC